MCLLVSSWGRAAGGSDEKLGGGENLDRGQGERWENPGGVIEKAISLYPASKQIKICILKSCLNTTLILTNIWYKIVASLCCTPEVNII